MDRWHAATGDRVAYISSQEILAAGRFPEIEPAAYEGSVQFVDSDGFVFSGAQAAFRALSFAPDKQWALNLYQRSSLFRGASERFYRFVAGHRMLFSRLTRWFVSAEIQEHYIVRSTFVRLLGVIYLLAFISLGVQVSGLVGPHGVEPASELMRAAKEQLYGNDRWMKLPTLCWWLGAGDYSLHLQCWAGVIAASLLILGILPLFNVSLLWVLYLSLTVAGGTFMGFQWENLLLETGLIAVFFAPAALTLGRGAAPTRIGLFLLRWLMFRLMFESGWVKLASGDPSWRNLVALDVHYETQPLPTVLGWLAHQSPHWLHAMVIVITLFIELALPFLIFGSRRPRTLAAIAFALLQLGIALTGNYGFFNLLTALLCIPLLDDGALRKLFRIDKTTRIIAPVRQPLIPILNATVRGAFFLLVVFVTSVQLLSMSHVLKEWNEPVRRVYALLYPTRSVNSYGLFAVMTTNRIEIVIEGSDDGKNWKPYEFKYKPGDPQRMPPFVAPHMPRLDWQMWFAALGVYNENVWLINLCIRLLQAEPEVLRLIGNNPFPAKAPVYIRAVKYEYHFTDWKTRWQTGTWWTRTPAGEYMPAMSAQGGL